MTDEVKKEEVPEVKMEETAPVEEEVKEKEVVAEEPKVEVEDVPKDVEPDEVACKSARFGTVKLNPNDGTLNCVISETNILSALVLDQLPLLASTRANVGISSGRYLFEVEIMQHTNVSEVRVGFSLNESSLFLGDKNTMGVSSFTGQFYTDGTSSKTFKARRFQKGDVVGLLLNRTEEGNKNTVSVFVNGKRHSEPQTIPDTFDGAMFPHVTVRQGAIVACNFTATPIKELPFICRTVGDVSKSDVQPSSVKPCTETEVTVAMGIQNDEWEQQHQMAHPDTKFVVISQPFLHDWMDKSSIKRQVLTDEALHALFKLMNARRRPYIWTLGHNLLSEERERFCARFAPSVKKCVVFQDSSIEKLQRTLKCYKEVSVPSEAEGWNQITFTENKETTEAELANWKRACKNQTKVEDFKATDKLKEKITLWQKFKVATEKAALKKKKENEIALKLASGEEVPEEKEEKKEEVKEEKKEGEEPEVEASTVDTVEWTAEDWMLAELRMQMHTLCVAFKEDCEDKERESFSADFLSHYYRLYAPQGHTFHHSTYGAKTVAEVMDLIKDTIVLDRNMLQVQNKDNSDFNVFVQHCENAREERLNLIGAGDEGAKLKFKAQVRPKHQQHHNQNKGGRGHFFGGKGPGGVMKGGKPQMIPQGGKGAPQQHFSQQMHRGPAPAKGAGKGPQMNKGGGGYSLRAIPSAPQVGMKRPGHPAMAPVPAKRLR